MPLSCVRCTRLLPAGTTALDAQGAFFEPDCAGDEEWDQGRLTTVPALDF